MCRNVSIKSARIFNENFRKALKSDSRTAITEHLVKSLFRISTTEYILTGTSGSSAYAVIIPSITQWKKEWEITLVDATPDLDRQQSVVNIQVEYRNKKDKQSFTANFHVEIRWSHGKFRYAPEAKLYKNFKWGEVAFVTSVFGSK